MTKEQSFQMKYYIRNFSDDDVTTMTGERADEVEPKLWLGLNCIIKGFVALE